MIGPKVCDMQTHRSSASSSRSPYITGEGYARLQREQQAAWSRRREVVKALSAAAAEGDRSENAEYIYRKKELREIDRRIRYLQIRMPELRVVTAPPDNRQQIFFAAWVTLEDESGEAHRYRIVGPDEFHHHRAYVSIDSPLAKALLSRRAEDDVDVRTPAGTTTYRILAVIYDQ